MSEYLSDFFDRLTRTPPFDVHDLPNGVRRFGHIPHSGPEAFLHEVFPPLCDEDILIIEEQIGRALPDPLKEFYRVANGMHLFEGGLSVYGLRRSFVRTGIESWQPFSIVTPNVMERPKDIDDKDVIFGSFNWAESRLIMSTEAPTVYGCSRYTAQRITQWPSFEDMLISEFERLSLMFDERGLKRSEY